MWKTKCEVLRYGKKCLGQDMLWKIRGMRYRKCLGQDILWKTRGIRYTNV